MKVSKEDAVSLAVAYQAFSDPSANRESFIARVNMLMDIQERLDIWIMPKEALNHIVDRFYLCDTGLHARLPPLPPIPKR